MPFIIALIAGGVLGIAIYILDRMNPGEGKTILTAIIICIIVILVAVLIFT